FPRCARRVWTPWRSTTPTTTTGFARGTGCWPIRSGYWSPAAPTITATPRTALAPARRHFPWGSGGDSKLHATGMPQGDLLVQLRNVSKDYRGLRPLRVARLDLRAGQSVALLGFDQVSAEVLVDLVTGATTPDSGE